MTLLQTGNGLREVKSTNLVPRQASLDEIPIIDIGAMIDGTEEQRAKVGVALRDACTNIGFFYIRNHGVPQDVIDRTFAVAKRYFAQDTETKMRHHVSKSLNNRGYAALLEENTDPTARGDLHESFDVALEVPADDPDIAAGQLLYGPNQWPEGDTDLRSAVETYYAEMRKLSLRLLHTFARALELPETHFDALFDKPLATMRLLHYPPQFGEVDERQIGIGAHSDYECFTILAQDGVPALQVLNKDGEWVAANPIPGCFVVNVGDQMARWTNNLFASTVHRAVNRSGRERQSIPFFFGPNYGTSLEALPSCVSPDNPPKFPPITSGEYINERFAATLKHYDPVGKKAL